MRSLFNCSLTAIDNAELGQFALVVRTRVVEHSVLECDDRLTRSLVDDADGLAVWDVLRAVSHRLFHREVVEFGIATVLFLYIICEEGVA